MDDELRQVITQFGRRIVDRPEQLRGALSDVLGTASVDRKDEITAVVAASRAGIAATIRDGDPTEPASSDQILDWFDELQKDGIALQDAVFATRSWASAFGAAATAQRTSDVAAAASITVDVGRPFARPQDPTLIDLPPGDGTVTAHVDPASTQAARSPSGPGETSGSGETSQASPSARQSPQVRLVAVVIAACGAVIIAASLLPLVAEGMTSAASPEGQVTVDPAEGTVVTAASADDALFTTDYIASVLELEEPDDGVLSSAPPATILDVASVDPPSCLPTVQLAPEAHTVLFRSGRQDPDGFQDGDATVLTSLTVRAWVLSDRDSASAAFDAFRDATSTCETVRYRWVGAERMNVASNEFVVVTNEFGLTVISRRTAGTRSFTYLVGNALFSIEHSAMPNGSGVVPPPPDWADDQVSEFADRLRTLVIGAR